jgi:hypothetical protein
VLHLFVEGEVTEATYAERINDHLGREQRFDKYVGEEQWTALVGHFEAARKRALQLVGQCPSGGCGPEEHLPHCIPTNRDPSTDVWKLLDSLQLRY